MNLGILAHVDAGKTSLTERLLHTVGVIDELGSVDTGSTTTDTLTLERQRGITIRSAVVSFVVDGVTVNLIDTPGHPDFIAEVERVLGVLDGVVLVVSAVEGVQAQTRILMRTLRRLEIPVLVFVNKIDRAGADCARVLASIHDTLARTAVAMGTVHDQGTRRAGYLDYTADSARFTTRMLDVLAEHDDELLDAYVTDSASVDCSRLRTALAAQTRRALVHPVYLGSAITGAGVHALLAGVTGLLPASAGRPDGTATGTVFKIERGGAGEKVAYLRMFSGTVRVRDRLEFRPADGTASNATRTAERVTAISVCADGTTVRRDAVSAGQIGLLRGLAEVRVGDTLGPDSDTGRQHFAPPTLETVVLPDRSADRGALYAALTQLAEQDPLINLRRDDVRQETSVSLYGEVQKEVIQATLAAEFGIGANFRESTTICIERPVGSGAAVEVIAIPPNPFLATVGLRVEPGPVGSGVRFQLEVELGSMPYSFFRAVEETVHATLLQGLNGWQVTDCVVSMTRSGYWARQSHSGGVFDRSMSSTAADFRNLTPLVLMAALKQAGTTVYEPVHRFHLELPADTVGPVLPVLAGFAAVPEVPSLRDGRCTMAGEIPAARVHQLQQRLPALTRGEGVLECCFQSYRRAGVPVATRPRTDHDPLNRREYLLHVVRRVQPG